MVNETQPKNEQTDFEKGNPLTVNADRTLKRGARRNLQRFKLRRKNLVEILYKHQVISKKTPFTEIGKNTTHQTLSLRAVAAVDRIELEEFARVLLAINKKRGYKSSRKAVNEEDGKAIDGMTIAKELYEKKLTPGQYAYRLLKRGKTHIPEFYRSDLQAEFDAIWKTQQKFYKLILTEELYNELQGKNKGATWKTCEKPFNIVGIKLDGKASEQKKKRYELRSTALEDKLNLEHLAIVLQEINNNLNNSSGYLGAISDRSKELYFNKITVGQYLYHQILKNPHTSLKNKVFYRQDYLDEFETLWETQAKHHSVLTEELKNEIRDVVIFYQRRLKSQKHLISNCQFEKYHKVIPKSSPLFQEFKIWQNLNNLELKNTITNEKIVVSKLDEDVRKTLFDELNTRGDLKSKDLLLVLKRYFELGNSTNWKCNFEKIEGNRTNQSLSNIFQKISENEGYGYDWSKKTATEIKDELNTVFNEIGINTSILKFDANTEGKEFDKQESYQLWHLLYSAEDYSNVNEKDKIVYGNSNVALKRKLHTKYGFKPDYANWLTNIQLQQDYGNLSSRAIRKILPHLQDGNEFSEACALAGYNHSNSLTKEELANRTLKDALELLPKNSLRNPVVEKILNQMVNLINQIIETYGKPNEVRIELARELKKSAKERKETTTFITKRTKENETVRNLITKEFGIPNPTKNDVVKYRLYEELKDLGYKSVFTNKYIPKEKLFSKEIDIEHIIPKAILFDDSFSNKTLAYRKVNLQKRDRTAMDFIENDYNSDLENYKTRISSLYNKGKGTISKGKYKKLLMSQQNLPDGFIERDLRNSQYIAKKAKSMLFEVFENVVSTTGSITDKLREDWDLINVMKELNLPKYKALGLTESQERKNGKKIEVIKDWTKRNDHRHHAMDALTVAFTTHNHIQYLNNLNAYHSLKDNETDLEKSKLYALKQSITKIYSDKNGKRKRKFIPPMDNFRSVAKGHIESILISFKTKNKVVTINNNKTNKKEGFNSQKVKTPRGRMHEDTYCGLIKIKSNKNIKLNTSFSLKQLEYMYNPTLKRMITEHLSRYDNNPKLGFSAKTQKLDKVIYKNKIVKEIEVYEDIMVVRKPITPDLKIEKVIDKGIQNILTNRLNEYENDKKKAFSDLKNNPIWLNEEKGISIKTVKIKFQFQNIKENSLHYKKNHLGEYIIDKSGKKIPKDFVNLGNNHHVAIYKDNKGKLHEKVVSFFEAVQRVNSGLPIIDKSFNNHLDWKFLFSMKQNEMFVFPSEEFNPNETDLIDYSNSKLISKQLFRVQKIGRKDYWFRHHLETTVTNNLEFTYKRISSPNSIHNIVKIRTNHLGNIVQVGEY